MDFKHISIEHCRGVLVLKISHPEKMSSTQAVFAEIVSALADLQGARAVLFAAESEPLRLELTAEQKEEIRTSTRATADEVIESYERVLTSVADLSVPVVSVVFGRSAGMWCCLALNADFCVASEDAYFRQAFINLETAPDAASFETLTRLVGPTRATAMMTHGERMSASSAFKAGMIYKVTRIEELDGEAFALASRLAAGPTLAYAAIRKQIREAFETDLLTAMMREADDQRAMLLSADFREGTLAVLHNRKPDFEGR